LPEAAFESASETRGVFITESSGNLLNAHLGVDQQFRRLPHSLFREQLTQAQSRALFEKVLKTGAAQVAFESQVMNRV